MIFLDPRRWLQRASVSYTIKRGGGGVQELSMFVLCPLLLASLDAASLPVFFSVSCVVYIF